MGSLISRLLGRLLLLHCRCTGIGGTTVHLLRGPATAHLHQHFKIFIDKYKRSASTRPSRRGVPRGGTRPARRGIRRRPRAGSSPLQDNVATFITKEPPPSKGETCPSHIQATLCQPGSGTHKGDDRRHALRPGTCPLRCSYATFMGV